MADIPKIPRVQETDQRFLIVTDAVSGGVVGLSLYHIAAYSVESGSSDITLHSSITIPGQGNQTSIFSVTFTGDDAVEVGEWIARQKRGEVTGTFST